VELGARVHLLAAILLLAAGPAGARVLLSQKEALALAFPSGKVERRTAYLTDAELKEASARGRVKVDSRVWHYYAGEEGYAYFETHVVRTMPETFMALVGKDGALKFVEVLAFAEPDDYLPRDRWLEQFQGRKLDGDLFVRRAIRNVTGSSLTAQALTDGARRVLAVHSVIHKVESTK